MDGVSIYLVVGTIVNYRLAGRCRIRAVRPYWALPAAERGAIGSGPGFMFLDVDTFTGMAADGGSLGGSSFALNLDGFQQDDEPTVAGRAYVGLVPDGVGAVDVNVPGVAPASCTIQDNALLGVPPVSTQGTLSQLTTLLGGNLKKIRALVATQIPQTVTWLTAPTGGTTIQVSPRPADLVTDIARITQAFPIFFLKELEAELPGLKSEQ